MKHTPEERAESQTYLLWQSAFNASRRGWLPDKSLPAMAGKYVALIRRLGNHHSVIRASLRGEEVEKRLLEEAMAVLGDGVEAVNEEFSERSCPTLKHDLISGKQHRYAP